MKTSASQDIKRKAGIALVRTGVLLAALSGVFNGLFTAPMKLIPHWRWENIWLVFILTSCVLMPHAVVTLLDVEWRELLKRAPSAAVGSALAFGFAWGFGSILFGLSVDRLGVSLSNTLVIGLSSALGAVMPMILRGGSHLGAKQIVLLSGVACFLWGVRVCGKAGRLRDRSPDAGSSKTSPTAAGYVFATGAGLMSAVFNIGYTLALPIAQVGEGMGYSHFEATAVIWLLMLGAGSLPNITFCGYLFTRNASITNYRTSAIHKTWIPSLLMGLLWGGSIFLYGAAAPMLGPLGPAIGWPLSLAVALVVANGMGIILGEWRHADDEALGTMRYGLLVLVLAILLCAGSSQVKHDKALFGRLHS